MIVGRPMEHPSVTFEDVWLTFEGDTILAERETTSFPPVPVDPAVAALGTDFRTRPDLSFELQSGWRNLREAILRRLSTPRGGLFYDADYGYDLREFLNEAATTSTLYQLERMTALELEKDPRILQVIASATVVADRHVRLSIQCETELGPYELIVSVDNLRMEVLRESQ